MTLRFRRTWLLSTVALAGLAFVALGLTVRAAAGQEEERASKEAQAKKESQEAAELEKIEAKLRGLEQEIKELRAAGKDDAAEKLAREGRELKEALQKQEAVKGKKDAYVRRVVELQLLQLKDLSANIKELKALGRLDEAEKLERQARELKEMLGNRGDGEEKKPAGAFKELAAKIDAMQHEAAKLREAGRTEEAEKILRQVAELRERSKLDDGKGKPEKDKPRDDGKKMADLERRIAELQAAGKYDEARELIVQAGKRDKTGAAAASPELAAAVKELREEVGRLRNEVAELRKIVGKEKGGEPRREKGERNDDDKKDLNKDK